MANFQLAGPPVVRMWYTVACVCGADIRICAVMDDLIIARAREITTDDGQPVVISSGGHYLCPTCRDNPGRDLMN